MVIHEADDREALELAIIEDVQREDLNAIEEARGYERLGSRFWLFPIGAGENHRQKPLACRQHAAAAELPDATRRLVADGAISAGHARALLSVKDPDAVARKIVADDLTVRDIEELARRQASEAGVKPRKPREDKDADTLAVEKTLSDALGLTVTIYHNGERGELRIRYETLEQLDGLCHRLTG